MNVTTLTNQHYINRPEVGVGAFFREYFRHVSQFLTNFHGYLLTQQMVRRTKKAMCTTSIVVGMFVACWLPYCCINLIGKLINSSDVRSPLHAAEMISRLEKLLTLDRCFYVLLMFNGVVDPLVYAVRMRRVRQGQVDCFVWIIYSIG